MPARDGGLVVYANYDNDDQGLVLAGNVKEVNDYIAKQIGLLGSEAVKPIPERYIMPGQSRDHKITLLDVSA